MKQLFFIALFLLEGAAAFAQLELGCVSADSIHFSCFPGLQSPAFKDGQLHIPTTHAYKVLFRQGDPYTVGIGNVPPNNDFTAFIGYGGSSTHGVLSVNQENTPGGVSVCEVHYDSITRNWTYQNLGPVDFSGAMGTARNCSGGISPWGTVVSGEEVASNTFFTDANGDGYHDLGWLVEFDPISRQVRDYNNDNVPDKLYALGKMAHENVVFANDSVAYFGADQAEGFVFKFIADMPQNFSSGRLYALKLDTLLALRTPTPVPTNGQWLLIPNTTPNERNEVIANATLAGATMFNNVEDVEIHPISRQVYFSSKITFSPGGVYRFTDNGNSVSAFEIFVANNTNYTVEHSAGVQNNALFSFGADNLTFDNHGNLYLLQDGGRDHIWFLRHDHSMSQPRISIFMRTPSGSEPTGLTFSPDNRFAFMSIQHPSGGTQNDVFGNAYTWDKATTIVIARKEYLGHSLNSIIEVSEGGMQIASQDTLPLWQVNVGTTLTTNIRINNAGAGNLFLENIKIEGDAAFSLGATPSNSILSANEFGQLQVFFSPTAIGTYYAKISIISSDTPNPYTFVIKGESGVNLPLELAAFEASRLDEHYVRLDWRTESEHNSDYFEIERMTAAETSFRTMGQLPAAGQSSQVHYYTYQDQNAFAGIAYYRLKQTNTSGDVFYSTLRAVDNPEAYELTLFPNPAQGILYLKTAYPPSGKLQVNVYDLQGKAWINGTFSVNQDGLLPLDVSALSAATYVIHLRFDGANGITRRFEKN